MPSAQLPDTAVGLDIETTSLDPTSGEIIEVSAIRFHLKTGAIVDRFQALAAPRHPVSAETTALTGITHDMLVDQPSFSTLAPQVKKFIGDDTIFAHNAAFDVNYLAYHGCPLTNPVWDTFVLASLAWPEAPSYNLGTLARQLNIHVRSEHRAAADVLLSFGILQQSLSRLHVSTQQAVTVQRLLSVSGQIHYLPLFKTTPKKLAERSTKGFSTPSSANQTFTVTEIVGPAGILSRQLPGFQVRPQQLALAQYIETQAQAGQSSLIEAGAGIGKTYAYLAAHLSVGGRLLISTYTRVLQDQLVEKDIPRLLQALGTSRTVASLKGRRHYICARRLAVALQRQSLKPPEAWGLIKVMLWLDSGGSGDLERLNFSHQHSVLVRSLHADSPICRLECSRVNPLGCPYQIARQAAAQAAITVINHGLLLSWGAGEEPLANAYRLIIIDEAHHLEDAAIAASEIDFSSNRVEELTATLIRLAPSAQVKTECQQISKDYAQLLQHAGIFLAQHTSGTTLRLSHTLRRSSTFAALASRVEQIISRLHFILGLLHAQESILPAPSQKLYRESVSQLQQLSIELAQWVTPKVSDRTQWVRRHSQRGAASLHDACFNPQAYIQSLHTLTGPAMLLSATLTVNNSFDYIQRRLQLQSIAMQQFPGDFDYQKQMKVVVVDNGPYPNTDEFDQFVAEQIENISLTTHGRLLSLFTSQDSLENIHTLIRSNLYKANISLYSQGLTGGRHNIAKRFREEDASVLLGSGSFWEGFDSPGETLSVVVIPRLPFPQVTDPIIEALSEQAGEGRAFREVMLPRMILRLRQGVGRLLRTHSDRGVIVILDRRLVEKDYSRDTLHSLPAAPVEILSSQQLPVAITTWFGSETIARWQERDPAKGNFAAPNSP